MSELASVENLDLLGLGFQADPQRVYEQLRAAGAVHHLPRHGWYLVTQAATAREVLRDAERFSSRVHKHTEPPPEVADEVAEIRSQGWPYVPALGTNDPPDHTRLRRLVQTGVHRQVAGVDGAVGAADGRGACRRPA